MTPRSTALPALLLVPLLASCACSGDPVGAAAAPAGPRADAFGWIGNTRLAVPPEAGLLANDPPGTVISGASVTSAAGGTVRVDVATGAFTYDPPSGLQNAVDSFTYRVDGAAPVPVTIALVERVWYVRNTDVGADLGTDRAPFRTLGQAQAASDADDVIFVFAGDAGGPSDAGQDAGITLKDGQRLLGEGVGLRIRGVPTVDPFPNARISNRAAGSVTSPVVRLATRNEVAGFTIEAVGGEAILGVGGAGHDLHDNAIMVGVGGTDGIRLLAVGGSVAVARNTVTSAPRDGIRVANDEDEARRPVAGAPVAGTTTLARNRIDASGGRGVAVHFAGAASEVGVHLLTNTIAGSGSTAAGPGIDVTVRAGARVSAALSRNTVSSSAAEAITLVADDGSSLAGFVADNTLSLAGPGFAHLRATTAGGVASGATACLELVSNGAPGGATFRIENGAASGAVRLFQSGNAAPASTSGTIIPVLEGACAIALDGAALFEANCGHCHTGNRLGRGNFGPDLTGATVNRIDLQLLVNPAMSDIRLTGGEVQAIAGALFTQRLPELRGRSGPSSRTAVSHEALH